jgi:hypothetical protein
LLQPRRRVVEIPNRGGANDEASGHDTEDGRTTSLVPVSGPGVPNGSSRIHTPRAGVRRPDMRMSW